MKPAALLLPLLVCLSAFLSACDQVTSALGLDDPAKIAAAKEAEGKAIGSACRQAMRALEDCYTLNPKAQKAAIFAGWRDMDGYMRDNKLEGITPVIPRTPAVKPNTDADDDSTPASTPDKDDAKKPAADKPAASAASAAKTRAR